MEPADSMNLVGQEQEQMPAASQEILATSEIRSAPEEEQQNQATAGEGAAQAQPDVADNNNEQQVTKGL